MTQHEATDAPDNHEPEEATARRRNFPWGWFAVPVLLLSLLALDMGAYLAQYNSRLAELKTLLKPGMTREECTPLLYHKNFSLGYTDRVLYVETQLSRPYTYRAFRWVRTRLPGGNAWRQRLLPLEMILVHLDKNSRVIQGDFTETWWGK